jgi:hypothetical protein
MNLMNLMNRAERINTGPVMIRLSFVQILQIPIPCLPIPPAQIRKHPNSKIAMIQAEPEP